MVPETRYAKTPDGVHIAYHVHGDGPVDLLWIHGFLGSLEILCEHPFLESFATRLTTFARVVHHDPRATGLSDRATELPDLETQVGDVLTVLDAVGTYRTAIVGSGPGCNVATLFASTYPDRTRALCLWGAGARALRAPDYPWSFTEEEMERDLRLVASSWGTETYAASVLAVEHPGAADDRDYIRWYAKMLRHWVTPGAALELVRRLYATDIRDVLPSVRVPTLVLAREWEDPEEDEYVAAQIPGAWLIRLPGQGYSYFLGDQQAIVDSIRSFLGAEHESPETDSVLRTVVFTDIVSSTETAARLGDRAWKELAERHHAVVRDLLRRHQGMEVDTAGDGFLSTFDGPARAIRFALAVVDAVSPLGIEVRAGLHAGECQLIDGKVGGITVATGARVGSIAGPSEVLVSQTVRDLVAGSGFSFEDRGEHDLKGVPGGWRLYAVSHPVAEAASPS